CRGACCAASYGGCVDDFSVESCRNIAGTYLGPDTTCAAASTSTCPTGACCLEGTCHDASTDGASISQFGCEEAFSRHGAYLGDGTTCATANTTCHGACCADTVLGCIDERSVEGCRNVLGTYLGNDTTCAAASTSTCPTGACCVEGTCRDPSTDGVSISQTGCEGEDFSLHGAYLGDGTTCATSECCISPGNTGCTDPSECCDYFGVITFSCEVGRCCNANGGSCAANEHCCNANATCELSSNTCYIMPGDSGCSNNSDCYPSVGCIGGKCCSPLRGFCVTADYCCNGNGICGNDHLCCLPAFRSGCTSDSDCCSGLVCDSGSCMGVTSP
ncbi:MAG: hypothetical protein HYR83_15620, partial [Planctomycetes bacterium]|nr:hypothetical protein [Planctomycetota bacterium]